MHHTSFGKHENEQDSEKEVVLTESVACVLYTGVLIETSLSMVML